MVMALLASIFIFPLFATIDIENRFRYSLSKLQEMQVLIVEAFLSHDEMTAHMSIAKSKTIESMVNKALLPIKTRLNEACFEPTRLLQWIFNRNHRHIINLTLQGNSKNILSYETSFFSLLEQEDLITSLMCHTCSIQLMVKQCSFNDYHVHYAQELRTSLLNLSSCQTKFISILISPSSITKDEFIREINNLQEAFQSVRLAYITARIHRIKHILEYELQMQSNDQLSHAFFLFQLGIIIRILTQITTKDNVNKDKNKEKHSKKFHFKERFIQQCPRLLSSFKSTVIIGVGSIFVLVPTLAYIFENGQWILVTLCVTQGDTVGGAFTTMKMRLMGTLIGMRYFFFL